MQTLSWWYLHRWAAQSFLSAFESLYMKKEEEISSVSVCRLYLGGICTVGLIKVFYQHSTAGVFSSVTLHYVTLHYLNRDVVQAFPQCVP